MNDAGNVGKAAELVRKIIAAAKVAAQVIAQNYVGAAATAVKNFLPQIIAIAVFLIIAPIIIFLCLPALLISSFLQGDSISDRYIQDNTLSIYGDYQKNTDDYIESVTENFFGGFLDPFTDYSSYGEDLAFDITRETETNGGFDTTWYAALHSVYFANDPTNMTPEKVVRFTAGILTYSVIETITDVIKAASGLVTLSITYTLHIEYREPYEVMRYFGFDEEQIQWAELMHSVVSCGYSSSGKEGNL